MRRKDKGLKKIIASLKGMHGKEIQVGIFGDRARRSANGSQADNLAYRYEIHDQGLGRNPQRETLQPAIDDAIDNDPVVDRFLSHDLDKGTASQKMNAAGKRMSDLVKQEITGLRSPPKKESTIQSSQRRYGGRRRDNPLIQTAEMRNSVRHRIK